MVLNNLGDASQLLRGIAAQLDPEKVLRVMLLNERPLREMALKFARKIQIYKYNVTNLID